MPRSIASARALGSRPGPSSSISATRKATAPFAPGGEARSADRHSFARPFPRVVQQVADQIGQVLLLAAKLEAVLQFDGEVQTALGMQLLECAHQPLDDGLDIGDDADRAGAGRGARAVEIERQPAGA